jgi:foldase protein PrsA
MSKLIRAAAAAATAAMALSFTACSSGSSGGGGDATVVSVNDQKITRADLDRRLESSPLAKQVLTQLVQQALIDQYAKANNVTIPQADIDKKEADIESKYPPGQFDAILAQQGLTQSDVQNILRQQAVLEKAVAPSVHVSESDIKAYFEKNHAQFDQPEQVRARHILVADKATADTIEAKLKAGGNFAALAKQYSTDAASKGSGGELGFFARGKMVPAFQDAAFALPVGGISPPVKSPFGWHIINVEAKKPAQTATLASAHAQIKTLLTQQAEQQQIQPFMESLRAKANITVTDSRFADVFPPPLPAPPPAASAAPAAPAPASAAPAPAHS